MQEEGWPLGLPLNVRVGLGRTGDYFRSISFNTTAMLTGSPTSSTDSSSGLDTEVSVKIAANFFFLDMTILVTSNCRFSLVFSRVMVFRNYVSPYFD